TPAPRQPADEVTLSELQEDPCPTCRRLRDHVPVAWAPAASGLVSRIVGQVLLREDSAATAGTQGRRAAAVSPRNINSPWLPIFQQNADDIADRFMERGTSALFTEFVGAEWLGELAAEENEMFYRTVSPPRDASRLGRQLMVTARLDGLTIHVPADQ